MMLTELAPGDEAIVSAVSGEQRVAIRIMELGLFPGAPVRVLGRAFGNLRLAIGAARLAIADDLASTVAVALGPSDANAAARSGRATR